jgi:PAS domain S-box-containing protein
VYTLSGGYVKYLERLIEKRTRGLALQTSLLTTIFDSIPDIVFCKDLNLRYTHCNRATEEVNNIKEADFIGKTDIEISQHPADIAEKIMEADRVVLREGRKTVTEELIAFHDGSMRVMETIRAPLVQNGVMIGLITIARDITQRKDVERELELQTATLTTLFDSIPDLIFTLNKSLRFTQCNKSFTTHFGLRKDNIINKGEEGLGLSAEMTEEHNFWNRKVIEEGRTAIFEERIPRFDGTIPVYETVKAPLILNGAVVGLLGIAHNITERKEMEDAALAASRTKSAFLANMSHEIRTPMNSIMGFSELALDGEVSPKTRDYLAKIQSNTEWLLQIINDILDISKIESGKMELENIPFDMHELFESCRTLITPKAAEKGITLHFYAEPSIGKSPLGDPTRLRQVLVNLLSNAVKFTNSGTVKVLTEIREKTGETVRFHFEIKDSGIGMTREQIERIFDPFTQAETGTTRKYGGTGLGLTISKNLIELMGGKLAVESIPGVGSKFSFDLTFDTIDVDEYEIFERKAVLDEIEKPIFDGEVLLCEDNAMNQQVISEHLARVGLKAIVAENGKVGVETIESRDRKGEKQFDLILMDIHMPVMDGLEAAERIIELDTGIPIVAMTANIMSSDLVIYRTSGMRDCIGKPFTSQELWRCLLKYLKPLKQVSKERNTVLKSAPVEEDKRFQRELKLIFVRTSRGKHEEIEKALEEGDIKQANRLAHSLKTNAGQIGEASLQKAAGEVERMLKGGKKLVTGEQLKKLETELAIVLEKLEPLLEEEAAQAMERRSTAQEPPELEPEKLKKLFEKLEPLLEEGNIKSLDYIEDLRAVAGSGGLIQQIEDFAFDSAVAAFAELKKKVKSDINNR